MIYLLHGKDTYRSRQNLRQITQKFFDEKNLKYHFFRLTPENFNSALFFDLAKNQTMFGGRYLAAAEELLADKNFGSLILENMPILAESENIFVFWERELAADLLEKIKTRAKKTQEFLPLSGVKLKNWIKAESKKLNFNVSGEILENLIQQHGSDLWAISRALEIIALGGMFKQETIKKEKDKAAMFDLTDAFASRDQKRAILLFEKYRKMGVPAEDIFWRLSWQIKTLLAVKSLADQPLSEIQKQTGFKEYPIKKALAAGAGFKKEELKKIFREFLTAYHQSRISAAEFDSRLYDILIKL
ncbi:MAG: hypothetical protein HYW71_02700 [Candidatus Niyogibacteria bacterium]|nr:hypothetical protein [Candidatus Niyogibacteria bacterium]